MIKSYPKEKDRKVKPERSLAKLKKDLDKVFNAFIRERDTIGGAFQCISCRVWKPVEQMNAGHYYSAGHHPALRWNEFNVNGQCVRCNCFLSGNLLEYEKGMIVKYGEDKLKWLELVRHNKSKLDRFEIKYLINHYKEKLRKQKL